MLVTLLCLGPLYLLFMGAQLFGTRPVEENVSGVPVLAAAPEDMLTLLLTVEGPTPGAALLRLDAWKGQAACLVLPADTLLPAGEGQRTVSELCAAAGPLQLCEALQQALGVAPQHWLSISADALAELFDAFSPVLDWQALGAIHDLTLLRRFAFNGGEGAITSSTAALLVRQCTGGTLATARLRAALYAAFLQEGLPQLEQPVIQLLRGEGEPLTDLGAVDIYGVQRLLRLLAADMPAVQCAVADGRATAQGWRLSEEGFAALRALLAEPEM